MQVPSSRANAALAQGPAFAHHSLAIYAPERLEREGEIVGVARQNPHVMISCAPSARTARYAEAHVQSAPVRVHRSRETLALRAELYDQERTIHMNRSEPPPGESGEEQTELAFRVTVTDPATFTAPAVVEGKWLARGDTIARYDCQRARR